MMAGSKIPFPDLPWVPGGHPLERKKTIPGGGAVLLEFAPGFRDPNWCANGHAGLVLSGTLGFELHGEPLLAGPGEGFLLDPGARHRAYNAGDEPVVLFIAPR